MSLEPGPLMDENVLRRAMRLDVEEVPPRLDPALIAAAASAARSRNELVIAVLVAFFGGWGWSEVFRAITGALAAGGIDPLATAIALVNLIALRVAPLLQTVTAPVVPIAILTAALVAALYERRWRIHVTPS